MWISIRAMKTQLAQNVRERLAIISDDITKMDGFFKSPDDINKIVGQSCVPCKPLCCSPTLLTLPLKIRVPPANATHLYIIILQLLNKSYGKYQILPNPHNTAQFNYVCPATAQFKLCMPCYSIVQTMHALLQHSSTMHALLQHSSTMHALLQHSSTMHALLQHSSTMHALLQHSSTHVHYFLLHVSHSDLISKEFINGVTVFNFLISPLKLQL